MSNIEKRILTYIRKTGKKLTKEKLQKCLEISGEDEVNFFNEEILKLEENGKLYLDKKGFYHIIDDNMIYIFGKIKIAKNGTGYVNVVDGGKKVTYKIDNCYLNGALPNDIVVINSFNKKYAGYQTGEVMRILKRDDFKEIYKYIGDGIFELYGVNSNVHFKVRKKEADKLGIGTLVAANVGKEIVKQEEEKLFFDGDIVKIIGHVDDPKSSIISIGHKYGFDHKFSKKVENIVSSISSYVSEEDLIDRRDLRSHNTFTIDGEDTKDIDDAIEIQKIPDGYILRVSIADVSHYVKDYSLLIEEAIKRGNSAYLADTVFPMLPHGLSNGICSLNPNEDRLTKTVEIWFDKNGEVLTSSVYKSVIRSKKKMTYERVNKILSGDNIEGYEPFKDDLIIMNSLSKLIEKRRKSRGSLDFVTGEFKVYTDEEGKPLYIQKRILSDAEAIIENFMISANIEVTGHFGYLDYPFIFRVHEAPDTQKLVEVLTILKDEGICENTINSILTDIEDKNIHPRMLANLLNEVQNTEYSDIVSKVILRVMKKAKYSSDNIGHFGLAEGDYCHFTSPIRRSADLINHIIIDYIIESNYGKDNEKKLIDLQKQIKSISDNATQREIAADKAEMQTLELKKFEYVLNNIVEFEGPILGRIKHISRSGIDVCVLGIITVKIDESDLNKRGYSYKKDSHTYVHGKGKDVLKLNDDIYVFDIEIDEEFKTINYREFDKEKDNLLVPSSHKVLKKTIKNT